MVRSERVLRWAQMVVALGLVTYCVLHFSGFLFAIGYYLQYVPHRALFMAFILTLTFLFFPAKSGTPRVSLPWYDIIFILVGVAACLYPVFAYDLFFERMQMLYMSPLEMTFAIAVMLLIVEAARRVVGVPLALVTTIFMIYPLVCQYLPGVLQGRGYSLTRIAMALYQHDEGIFGTLVGIASTILVAFIIFAVVLTKAGAGAFFSDLAFGLFGGTRGGPAKGSVVASGLFGMLSGMGSANVAATGAFTIPLMKKTGYEPNVAGAIEVVASNGGHFMPPVMGSCAFIMAEFLGVSYGQICIWALLPAILYYLSLFIQVDLIAAKENLRGLPRAQLPSVKKTLMDGWGFLVPLVVLVYLLMVLHYGPAKAAMWAILSIVVVTQVPKRHRLSLSGWGDVVMSIGRMMCTVGCACAAANIIAGCVILTGFTTRLSILLADISGGSTLILLLLTAVACYILGMGLSGIALYVTMVLLVAPTVIEAGILPIAAHLFVYMWGCTAAITPPVALLCFVAAPISGGTIMKTGWNAMKLGIVTYVVPFLFAFSPALLLIGPIPEVVLASVTALWGISALAAGVAGYLLKRLNWLERILLMGGGIIMAMPGWQTDIIGALIIGIVVAWHVATWLRERGQVSVSIGDESSQEKRPW
ncbi:TRAP transporter permease [Chloroflexota bacterium]